VPSGGAVSSGTVGGAVPMPRGAILGGAAGVAMMPSVTMARPSRSTCSRGSEPRPWA